MRLTCIAILACTLPSGIASAQLQGVAAPQQNQQAQPQPATQTNAPTGFSDRNPRYLVRPGDVLDLTFPFSTDFNQTVPVQPDGFVTLRELGDVHIADMTVPQVRDVLTQEYSKILNKPSIDVSLKEFEKPYFIVGGWVKNPGRFELHGQTTASQAIALAGGFTDASKHSTVLLFRRVSNEWVEVKRLNLKKMLANADIKEDMTIGPEDMLYVPQNTMSKVKGFIAPRAVVSARP